MDKMFLTILLGQAGGVVGNDGVIGVVMFGRFVVLV